MNDDFIEQVQRAAAGRDCRKPLATGEERSCGGEKERFHGKKD